MTEAKGEKAKKDRLPSDRLSSLVQVAIADAKRLYANRPNDYVPASERYHAPLYLYKGSSGASQCQICLAGAVIAGTLGGNRKQDLGPSNFRSPFESDPFHRGGEEVKLRSLDYVRTGALEIAYNLFHDMSATQEQLDELNKMFGLLAHRHFQGWPEFMMHIESLEVLVKAMVDFEDTWGLVRVPQEGE